MEGFGRQVVYPTIEQICDVNRRMITAFGGTFLPPQNLRNGASLEHTLTLIAHPVFGQIPYPSLHEKAAILMHHMITGHVFFDGNKRTAVHMAWEFLRSNHVAVFLDRTVADLAVQVATGGATHQDVLAWLHDHQER
jgi:death on curing protein